MAHSPQVVDLIGLHFLHDADQVSRVRQVAVVQDKIAVADVRVLIEMVYPRRIQQGGPSLDAVYFIPFFKQEFG